MKNSLTAGIISSFLVLGILTGCEKKDGFTSDPVEDYYIQGQVGKYILYKLDSTRFVDHGQRDTVVNYFAKDSVISATSDGTGRKGWMVVRYLKPINSTEPYGWVPSMTYQLYPGYQNLEVMEGNFRFLKLSLPIKDGYTWRGNGYLPTAPYGEFYGFSNDGNIQTWDYAYENVGAPMTINSKNYDSTITVTQIDDAIVVGTEVRNKNYWVEKYAKNVGLVYKEVVMYEYQPPNGNAEGYKHGFSVRMEIIDHN